MINGNKGRARYYARVRREREAKARAAGVDPTDRAAFHAWDVADRNALMERIRHRNADRIDGYDRDDLGLSPDY